MKTQEKAHKKRSMLISAGIHAGALLLAMIPVASSFVAEQPEEERHVIVIDFAQFASSSSEGLKAASQVKDDRHKPVVDADYKEPDVIEADKLADVAQITETVEAIESDVIDEIAEEVAAAEDHRAGDAREAASSGGSNATLADGNSKGTDAAGDDAGRSGLDGTGVITRKIIYREDITQVAKYNGVIAVNLCIDRRGYVTAVAKNAERTTITDSNLIRRALELAAGYRFEADYSAALRECGVLTFIFEVADDQYNAYIVAN